ncbi:MAG TPA: hypothetical protein VFT66_19840 [Roseiflexaceae bacterium]|nr:hypothetical protein [Roseiflexaceae bacterium]
MALDLLQKFLGSNPQKQQDYADFVQRYQNDPSSISDEEAARRYREMMRNSPQDLADQANQHGFGQLPEQDRRQLAQQYEQAHSNPGRPFDGYNANDPNQAADPRQLGRMTQQAENQDPDLFGQLFGQNSPLNSTIGKAALAGAAAFLASRVLGGQGQSGAGGGLGGLLGGQQGGAGGGLGGLFGGQQGGTPDLGAGLNSEEKRI